MNHMGMWQKLFLEMQASLHSKEKSRTYSKAGPGRRPYRKTDEPAGTKLYKKTRFYSEDLAAGR